MKRRFQIAYFYFGGAVIVATVVGFLYTVLGGSVPSWLQVLAATVLLGIGAIFMTIGEANS